MTPELEFFAIVGRALLWRALDLDPGVAVVGAIAVAGFLFAVTGRWA